MKTELEILLDRCYDLGVECDPGYDAGMQAAGERAIAYARNHDDISVERLKVLHMLCMQKVGLTGRSQATRMPHKGGSQVKDSQQFQDFCDEINQKRSAAASTMGVQELYDFSFDAFYGLETLHPWPDGNFRMARLLMHWLQLEYGLIPTQFSSKNIEDCKKALYLTQEAGNPAIFRQFMNRAMCRQLSSAIASSENSAEI